MYKSSEKGYADFTLSRQFDYFERFLFPSSEPTAVKEASKWRNFPSIEYSYSLSAPKQIILFCAMFSSSAGASKKKREC